MRTKFLVLMLVLVGVAIPVGVTQALVIAPPPGPVRVANSDAVFVGRDVEAKAFPGAKDPTKYRIAIVKVNEILHGLKEEKTVRVGFIPFVQKPGVFIGGGGRSPQLQVGQEGLFMVTKHPAGKFYNAPGFGYFVSSQDMNNFDTEIKSTKKALAILKDTKAALQSKDAEERLLAAAIQIARYRTQKPPFPNKEEPIDAEESKLILNAIANAKWGPVKFGQVNPEQLLFQIGISDKDGFVRPKTAVTPEQMQKLVQTWVAANAGTYRMKRFVAAETK
jgi:hypothetical protein